MLRVLRNCSSAKRGAVCLGALPVRGLERPLEEIAQKTKAGVLRTPAPCWCVELENRNLELVSQPQAASYAPIVFTMSKIGRYIATTMPPTTTPRNTIITGSMSASNPDTAASTSSS